MAVSQRLRALTTVSEPAGADGRIHADIDPGARPRTADDALLAGRRAGKIVLRVPYSASTDAREPAQGRQTIAR